jgi:ribonuclease VapC
MFVDASALVAILAAEPERAAFLRRLEDERAVTSAIAIFEASHAVARKLSLDLRRAREEVDAFLREAEIDVIPITAVIGEGAVDAARRYGKASGHPAKLNMGDCFSYAMARDAGLPLLYKGDDFARTDLA